jgi:hypothetical protein
MPLPHAVAVGRTRMPQAVAAGRCRMPLPQAVAACRLPHAVCRRPLPQAVAVCRMPFAAGRCRLPFAVAVAVCRCRMPLPTPLPTPMADADVAGQPLRKTRARCIAHLRTPPPSLAGPPCVRPRTTACRSPEPPGDSDGSRGEQHSRDHARGSRAPVTGPARIGRDGRGPAKGGSRREGVPFEEMKAKELKTCW